MLWAIGKIFISAIIISFTSWLAHRKPGLAGFIIALPISSLLAIAFTQTEFRDPAKSAAFARSILVSVPLSLTFFVPFLFADRFKISFWGTYALGIFFLIAAFAAHHAAFRSGTS